MIAVITGFTELPGKVNPSALIARRLNRTSVSRLMVSGVELPENFYELPKIARALVRKLNPDVVISLGWDSISSIKVEKVALNVMSSVLGSKEVPDHFGNRPMGEGIFKKGPTAYWSTIPAESIVEEIRKEGLPASVSYFAGTHCCGTLLYSFLHAVKSTGRSSLVGHLHIPQVPEMQMGGSQMKLDDEIRAVTAALRACSRQLREAKR